MIASLQWLVQHAVDCEVEGHDKTEYELQHAGCGVRRKGPPQEMREGQQEHKLGAMWHERCFWSFYRELRKRLRELLLV